MDIPAPVAHETDRRSVRPIQVHEAHPCSVQLRLPLRELIVTANLALQHFPHHLVTLRFFLSEHILTKDAGTRPWNYKLSLRLESSFVAAR